MEAFQLLSRGGARFNKKRFKEDVGLFTGKAAASSFKGRAKEESPGIHLPPDLDFFKYAKNTPSAGKRKVREDDEDKQSRTDETEGALSEAPSNVASGSAQHRRRVTTKGTNVPAPMDSFSDLKSRYHAAQLLLTNLEKYGFQTPTEIQSYGIPILLEGRNLAAISPTGTGKTLSYLIPVIKALENPVSSATNDGSAGVRAVILAPTRELAHQIYNECLKLTQGRKWRIVLFSKATAATLSDRVVRDKIDIIIATPLRLVASMQSGQLELHNVRHLILDEADRLMDSEFLEQTQEVAEACTHDSLQIAVFSATIPAGIEKLVYEMLKDPIRVVVGIKDTPLPLISQTLTYVADEASKLPTLLQYLAQPYKPPILVFTSTQPRATSLAEQLVLYSVPNVDCLHAGLTRKQREDAVSRMMKGETWVMVTTEVMARGMDFKGVRGVINYDFPTSVQSYVHRIGRTGRMGREGMAITYFTDDDAPYLKPIANVLLQSGSQVPEWISKLPKPSKMKRRQMGKVKRGDKVTKAGEVGRRLMVKKKDMVQGSKRRKMRTANQKKS